MVIEPRCVRHVSLDRVCRPTLRFPPQGPPGRVPLLQRYQSATTSRRSSRRASLPSLGGTSVALVRFAPWRTSAPPRPGVGNPVSPTGNIAEETTGSPKFLGNPDCPFAHVQSTPVGLLTPDHCGAATWPLVCERQRLTRKVFRRSIAWLSDWLSTLRGVGHPNPTQDSLPAAGQALPDGLYTRKVVNERFQRCFLTSHPPFPSFLGAITSTEVGSPDRPGSLFAADFPASSRKCLGNSD